MSRSAHVDWTLAPLSAHIELPVSCNPQWREPGQQRHAAVCGVQAVSRTSLPCRFHNTNPTQRVSTRRSYLIKVSRELNRRLRGTGVDVFPVHPGIVASLGEVKSDKSYAVRWLLA
jgi:hypothetical protein